MATIKVDVTHPAVYDAESNKLSTGVQEIEQSLAEKLIKRGTAKAVEVKKAKAK